MRNMIGLWHRPNATASGRRADLLAMVNGSGHGAAVSVLNAAPKPNAVLTPLEAVRQLGDEPACIETLGVWLGGSNVLGSAVQLRPY
jgi:hypothetical protein